VPAVAAAAGQLEAAAGRAAARGRVTGRRHGAAAVVRAVDDGMRLYKAVVSPAVDWLNMAPGARPAHVQIPRGTTRCPRGREGALLGPGGATGPVNAGAGRRCSARIPRAGVTPCRRRTPTSAAMSAVIGQRPSERQRVQPHERTSGRGRSRKWHCCRAKYPRRELVHGAGS
jgi:hypothetical protein